MKAQQSGFTLIELVVVIVILGILAATALPKFIDLSDKAEQAATDGMAGALSSASATNYGYKMAKANNAVSIASCADVSGALLGGLAGGYTISGTTGIAPGAVVTSCTVAKGAGSSNFTAIGT